MAYRLTLRYNAPMKRLSTIGLFLLLTVAFVMPLAQSYAQEAEETSSRDEIKQVLAERIEDLKRQVAQLVEKIIDQRREKFEGVVFLRNLTIGSEGKDVRALQDFLAHYTQFYPEKRVTGYYGPLTAAAVQRFKAEYNIYEAGFGEASREKILDLFRSRSTFAVSIPSEFLTYAKNDSEDEFEPESLAREIHKRVNMIREEEGLDELAWDGRLADVALAHSREQARDNEVVTSKEYVCQYPLIRHEGFEDGFLVRDRVEDANIDYRTVGENIAMVPLVESRTYSYSEDDINCPEKDLVRIRDAEDEEAYLASLEKLEERTQEVGEVTFLKNELYDHEEVIDLAVEGWMDSPGHRENIVFPDYTHSGVGIVRINNYFVITQNFVGR